MPQPQHRTPAAPSKSSSHPQGGSMARETPRGGQQVLPPRRPTCEQIAQRAYELYLARGCVDGHDHEDWVQAERELTLARL